MVVPSFFFLFYYVQDPAGVHRVEPRGGFVQKEHFRVIEQPPAEVESHFHLLVELAHPGISVLFKSHHIEKLQGIFGFPGVKTS